MGGFWLIYVAASVLAFMGFLTYIVWEGSFHQQNGSIYMVAALYGLLWWGSIPLTIFGVFVFYSYRGLRWVHGWMIEKSKARYRKLNN